MGKPLSNYIVCNIFMFLVVSLAACQPTVEPAFLPAPTPTTNETNHTIIPTVDRSVESTAESPPPLATLTTPITTTDTLALGDPTPGTSQSQILYMVAQQSDAFGSSENQEGYVYAVVVDSMGTLLHAPTPLSGSTPVGWGRLYPAPDGSLVALGASYFGEHIYLLDPLTGEIRRLFGDRLSPGGSFFNWYPDSVHVLIWAEENYADAGLWQVNVENGEYIPLIPRSPYPNGIMGSVHGGVGLADGQVFYSHQTNPPLQLLTFQNDSKTPELIAELFSANSFALSPDGEQIAFAGGITSDAQGLMVMNADGSNLRLLNPNLSGRYRPSLVWSPDSRTIAFRAFAQTPATDIGDVPADFKDMTIHLIDVETGRERPLLTDGSTGHIDPVWSPDGSQIAFASMRSGHSEIWVVNADGTNLQQLTHHGQFARYPVWLTQPNP